MKLKMKNYMERPKHPSSWKLMLLACAFTCVILAGLNFARTGEFSLVSGDEILNKNRVEATETAEIKLTSAELYDMAYQVNPERANVCAELGYPEGYNRVAYACLYNVVKGGKE